MKNITPVLKALKTSSEYACNQIDITISDRKDRIYVRSINKDKTLRETFHHVEVMVFAAKAFNANCYVTYNEELNICEGQIFIVTL